MISNTCDCIYGTCPCARRPGPAVFRINRDGVEMNVCTRCDLTRDRPSRELLSEVTNEDLPALHAFDPLGALCVGLMLNDKHENLN